MARTCKSWSEVKRSRMMAMAAARGNATTSASAATAYMGVGGHDSSSTSSSTSRMPSSSASYPGNGKHPKTVLEKVVYAIREERKGGSNGSWVSRQVITKYLKNELDYDNVTAIRKALKKGVEKGALVQNNQSFRVNGDPIYNTSINSSILEVETAPTSVYPSSVVHNHGEAPNLFMERTNLAPPIYAETQAEGVTASGYYVGL